MADQAVRSPGAHVAGLVGNLVLVASAAAAALVFSGAVSTADGPGDPPVATQVIPPPVVATGSVAIEAFADAIPVLTYHDVSVDNDSRFAVTPAQLAEHMAVLDAAGFTTVDLETVRELASGAPVELPPRPILLTFDDGALGTWTLADPILRRHGFTAVAFIVTAPVPERQPSYYLSWQELELLRRSGRWEIGAHTHNGHRQVSVGGRDAPWLTNLAVSDAGELEPLEAWRIRVESDLDTNVQLLRARLGVRAAALSYPFSASRYPTNHPAVPDAIQEIVSERFEMAFTAADTPRAVTEGDDLLLLPRLASITDDVTGEELLRSIDEAIPRPPPPDALAMRWTPEDGSCQPAGNRLLVRGAGYVTCVPQLVNARGWTDYRLAVEVVGASRTATAVVGVRHSTSGRLEVAIGESSYVVREQRDDGAWIEHGRVQLPPRDRRSLTVDVQGTRALVAVDDRAGRPVELSPTLDHGPVLFGMAPRAEHAISFVQPTIDAVDPTSPQHDRPPGENP